MTPYYADDWLTVYLGDCREVMAAMEPESVHCVVTSPPYWGLRSYGSPPIVSGGDSAHAHEWTMDVKRVETTASVRWQHTEGGGTREDGTYRNRHANAGEDADDKREWGEVDSGRCVCGATLGHLGLEPTPELFVEAMVAVFREVRRVLRKDGTVWLNLGDSYAGSGPNTNADFNERNGHGSGQRKQEVAKTNVRGYVGGGLKPKDLVGIPWRVAFALQADGWYLRSDIVWSKPNPMPESVTDRPTKAHEYVFLLSKSPRYYYDADAVAETSIHGGDIKRGLGSTKDFDEDKQRTLLRGERVVPMRRNLRSVWNIATEPYPGAHFATFPRALVKPCIKAGTSEKGVCPECGAPWVRETTTRLEPHQRVLNAGKYEDRPFGHQGSNRQKDGHVPGHNVVETVGWRPSCTHGLGDSHATSSMGANGGRAPGLPGLSRAISDGEHRPGGSVGSMAGAASSSPAPVPATVLDPFAGSGTTGLVAQSLSRRAVLIDLSADYLRQLMDRNRDIPLGLAGA